GQAGIGHTRWATHGAATAQNAHPHIGGNQVVALAHNGVIENFESLRSALECEGFRFRSETDSEVIAHLVSMMVEKQLAQCVGKKASPREVLIPAVSAALAQLRGTYGLVI